MTAEIRQTTATAASQEKAYSPLGDLARRLLKKPGAVVGLVVLAVIILSTIFAPQVAPYDPVQINPSKAFSPPGTGNLLGTDHFGRDLLSRIIYGGRLSLTIGIISTGIATSTGIILGILSGFLGGWVDSLIGRFLDILLAFPGLLLTLGVAVTLGAGLQNLMIAVGIGSIPGFARLVRGTVLSAKENTYIQAATALGCPDFIIMLRHILPNVMAPIIVMVTLSIAGAILTGASLSYLGMGAQPPTPEWGVMLSDGRNYMQRGWWICTFPGIAIMLTVISINLVGDGLRDVLDPRLKSP
jgi:ABC-type dipeptide/oligopeptide/nickel transport system permease subunit